jgi:hypothetical protein
MDLPPVPYRIVLSAPAFANGLNECALTYVATGEVTTLEHEVSDDTVELGAGVAETLLAGAEGAEVLGSLRDNLVEELEDDTLRLLYGARRLLVETIKLNAQWVATYPCWSCRWRWSCRCRRL